MTISMPCSYSVQQKYYLHTTEIKGFRKHSWTAKREICQYSGREIVEGQYKQRRKMETENKLFLLSLKRQEDFEDRIPLPGVFFFKSRGCVIFPGELEKFKETANL